MTRNDYFLLARVLREARASFFVRHPEAFDEQGLVHKFWDELTDEIKHELKRANPSFSANRFELALSAQEEKAS